MSNELQPYWLPSAYTMPWASIESAISDLMEAVKGDDLGVIEAKSKALGEASAGLAQRMYAEQAQAGGEAAPEQPAGGPGGQQEDVVDAEFEEVKEDNK